MTFNSTAIFPTLPITLTQMLTLLLCILPFILYILQYLILDPLRNFPGPLLAKFTNWYRLLDVAHGRADKTQARLHRRYGPAVRLGPNIISLSDPSLIKIVYRTRNPYQKSPMYAVNDVKIARHITISTLFGTRDEDWHARVIKPIKQLYTTAGALKHEGRIDEVLRLFCSRIDELFVVHGKACPLDDWINFLCWDFTWNINFSAPLGCIGKGRDVSALLSTSQKAVAYFAWVSQIPSLDYLFEKNPIVRIGPPSFVHATMYAYEAVGKRKGEQKSSDEGSENGDFLDCLLLCQNEYAEVVDDNLVVNYLLNNVVAGSDTTVAAVMACLYYTLRCPPVLRKLQEELDKARLRGDDVPKWHDIQRLPYLDAVVREAMRLHPSVGLLLERVVPTEGLDLPDGRFIPAGTIVGMNPWVMNRSQEVFGAGPDEFRPERWLQNDEETKEEFEDRLNKMKGADFTFGHGKRMCVGKYVALVEIYKIVATVFKRYDMRFEDETKEWTVKNTWFIYSSGVDVMIKKREA